MFRISLQGRFLKTFISIFLFLTAVAAVFCCVGRREEAPSYPTKEVTIPEGYNSEQIDDLLFREGITTERGALTALSPKDFGEYWFLDGAESLEGFLFPDTYDFFIGSSSRVIARKFLDNFKNKASNLFISKRDTLKRLTLASIIEKEVPDQEEKGPVVAGILLKRELSDVPLQVDATLCYVKNRLLCGEIIPSDKDIDSPYNSYRNKGFPPGPISNPGLSAIKASLQPTDSEYWYFISDPKTKETVFAKTLDEHNQNIVKYLR